KSYISHNQVIQKIMNADILLLLIPNVKINKNIIPGKIFEYLRTGNYIMGIGSENGDVAEILRKTKHGEIFSPERKFSEILEKIILRINKKEKMGINWDKIGRYTREDTTRQLVGIFEKTINQ
ncbi:hypothetical protein ACFLYK_03415, partial [Candidatus Cloacimonadota bacterium]